MPDVNGSKFHLLLSKGDWLDAHLDQESLNAPLVSGDETPEVVWTSDAGLQLHALVDFSVRNSPARLTAADLRGAAVDRFGTWWEIGPDRTSIVAMRDGVRRTVWPVATPVQAGAFKPAGESAPPMELGGLTVTTDHRLVVGAMARGLLVFDLFAGGEPTFVDWTVHAGTSFSPVALSARTDGGLYVLDTRRTPSAGLRVWSVDARMEPAVTAEAEMPESFADCENGTTPSSLQRLAIGWEHPFRHVTAIEALPGTERYLLLDRNENAIVACEADTAVAVVSLDTALASRLPDDAVTTAVRGHDLALLLEDDVDPLDGQPVVRPVLFISDQGGDQVFAFDLANGGLEARSDQYQLRRHAGKGIAAGRGQVWFDTATAWYPLTTRARARYETTGTIVTAAFDSAELACTWHRILLDGCVPLGALLRIESRAADSLDALGSSPWQSEPTPYLRRGGTEQTYDIDRAPAEAGRTGTWETLLQRAEGRWCQLRLTLGGNGGVTPRIEALRLVFPRFSYLHQYLPAVFVDQDASTGFLERYLANVEGLYTDMEERIVDAQMLFDSRTVPTDYLDWLASWFGHVFDADLAPERRRLFLENAVQIFQERGTVPGLIRALRLVLDDCPEEAFADEGVADPFGVRILEQFTARRLGTVIPDGPGEIGNTIVSDPQSRWTPDLGADELHSRFRNFLTERYGDLLSLAPTHWLSRQALTSVRVSPTTPARADAARDWQDFLASQLGIADPDFTDADLGQWQRFLLQRYTSIARLRAAHGGLVGVSSFAAVPTPATMPATGAGLVDWFDLLTHVLPISRSAHRFTVLLPARPEESEAEQLRHLALAQRVVDVQRPAHTSFDVRPYWAAFQLGDARLGLDTQLGADTRRHALTLGRERLASAPLAGISSLTREACP